jgi:hypothetical protein
MKLLALLLALSGCTSALPSPRAQVRDACDPPAVKLVPLVPSFCGDQRGFYWNGTTCRATGLAEDHCACELTLECTLFDTLDACELAHASCR